MTGLRGNVVIAWRANRYEKEQHMPSADKAFAVDSTNWSALKSGARPTQRCIGRALSPSGGHGATASSVIVYEIEPGKRLGWHTDATEETQYIIAGTGKLYVEDGSTIPIGPGSVFVLPTPMRHDVENTGKETLRAVAFFAAAMFTQDFDQVMMPPKTHILGTPNRNG